MDASVSRVMALPHLPLFLPQPDPQEANERTNEGALISNDPRGMSISLASRNPPRYTGCSGELRKAKAQANIEDLI